MLATNAFHIGTKVNHLHQTNCFMEFCDHYHLHCIHPSATTLCYYITHLTHQFNSSKSMLNYISGVKFLNKQLGLIPKALTSFPVISLFRATDITMCTPPLRCLPILPKLLHCLRVLTISLGPLGPDMWGYLAFCFCHAQSKAI